ncbi:MAG TPA: LuxR C-terminal-related transcriptional regulator [Candidatus Saccharimonadales bacterium]|nr:LuxR C-terminal-related transcriptional regulator [Candidatus Saccharimonadales bacterium]
MNDLSPAKIEEGERMIALAEEVGADATKLMGSLALLEEALRTGVEIPLSIEHMQELENTSLGMTPEESSSSRSKPPHEVDIDTVIEDRHAIQEAFNAKTMPETIVKAVEIGALIVNPDIGADKPEPKQKHLDVLVLIARGYGMSAIGDELGVHRNTVTNRLSRIMEILEAKDLNHAIRRAYETGWFKRTDEELEKLYMLRIGAGLIMSAGLEASLKNMNPSEEDGTPSATIIPLR